MKWKYNIEETSDLKILQLPDWDVILEQGTEYEFKNGFHASSSGLRYKLIFQRIKANHVLHTYIPSIMLCVVTIFSGMIPPEKAPEKVTICVTTFLSMIALFGAAK